jgi:hypothetical protein
MQLQRQASAASAQGQYTKKVYDQNAKTADLEAQDAIDRGQIQEQRSRLATRQNIGASRAAQAASGVDVSSGSAADVQASEAGIGALDALTVRNNAAREAWGYKVEGVNLRQQGELAAFAGDQAAAGYRAQSLNTVLTGAVNTYGIYQRNKADRQDLRKKANRTGGP